MSRRINPPASDTVSARTADLFELAATRTGEVPATIGVLSHSYRLLEPFLTWAGALALKGRLDTRHHEILALRIAYRCDSTFEWDEHVEYARNAGMTTDEIDAIRGVDGAVLADDAESALLEAADQLHAAATVDDAIYERLARHFTEAQLVEIPMVVGQYAMLSMLCGFAGIDAAASPAEQRSHES